jgi:hypothetical protein
MSSMVAGRGEPGAERALDRGEIGESAAAGRCERFLSSRLAVSSTGQLLAPLESTPETRPMSYFARASAAIPAFSWLLLAACGGGGSGSATSTSGAGGDATSTASAGSTGAGGATASSTTGTGAPMCNLDLFLDRPACQARIDASCCAEEQACGADQDCVDFVTCLDDCPDPTDDICLGGCGSKAPQAAQAKLTAIGHCSGMHPALEGQACAFP